ncbi:MAG: putative metal-binding motif-containing protein [archaeon]
MLLVSAEELGLDFTKIYNCKDSGLFTDEACNKVIGYVHHLEEFPTGRLAPVNFPESPIPPQLIGCTNSAAVMFAKYNGNGGWIEMPGEVVSEIGITVDSYIDEPGYYAIVKKIWDENTKEGEETCVETDCLGNGPFVTYPYNRYLDDQGDTILYIREDASDINLKFCGMTAGCRINEGDGVCDPYEQHCFKGVALDCPQTCTAEPDKCCHPEKEGICDTDCEGTEFTSPDYDCQFKDYDVLAGLEAEPKELPPFEVPAKDGWEEYEIKDIFGEDGKIVNGPITFKVGEGDNVACTLWFKDFMYQDFNDNWRLLFPARQLTNGHSWNNFLGNSQDLNWQDIKAYSEETSSTNELKEYEKAEKAYAAAIEAALETGPEILFGGNTVDTDVAVGGSVITGGGYMLFAGTTMVCPLIGITAGIIGGIVALGDEISSIAGLDDEEDFSNYASTIFWAHPSVWLQSNEDGPISQFWFVDTPIKKIKFKARFSRDGVKTCETPAWCDGQSNGIKEFTVNIPVYESTDLVDPDRDGVSSGIDCHDTNEKIYPGAEETCDGIDNNCNSFTSDTDKEKAEFVDYFQLDSKADTPSSQSQLYTQYEWSVSDSAVMPCDGFIKFEPASGGVYVEIKRIDTPLIRGLMTEEDITDYNKIAPYAYPDFLYQIKEPLYIEEIFDLPGYFGFDPITTLNTPEKIIDFFGYGSIENLPIPTKDRHQVIFARYEEVSIKKGVINVNADQVLEINNSYHNYGEDRAGCKIGMLDSCTCLLTPLIWNVLGAPCKPEKVQDADYWGTPLPPNKGYYITPLPKWEHDITQGSRHQVKAWERDADGYNNTIFRKRLWEATEQGIPSDIDQLLEGNLVIDLLKGDLVKYYVNQGGYIEGELYCYQEGDPNPEKIDEGCEEEMIDVHICKKGTFIDVLKRCEDPLCLPFKITKTQTLYELDAGSTSADNCKVAIANQYSSLDIIEFDTYLCPEDEDCYQFYGGQFKVCGATEICGNGFDDDCDGAIDRDDPDCEGKCYEGECDVALGQWCVDSQWTADSYCINCGHIDSTCQKSCDPSITEEEFKSCDSGCLEGACDTAANLLCTNGLWINTGYSTKCKTKDADFSTCDEASCDTQQNLTCIGEKWKSDGYCLTACGKKDESCHSERKDKFQETPYCETGAFDIYANKWCNENHEWTVSEYCNHYGAYDSDCGPKACTEKITLPDGTEKKNCDYIHQKYCDSGRWTSDGYCALQNCGADIKSRNVGGNWGKCSSCEETGTEEGPTCMDGVDNDCDGYIDCDDSDCPADLEGCSCNTGEEKSCYSDPFNRLGLCAAEPGIQKCVNDQWDACEGAFTPQMEVCNGFDDDCDGSIDEGCGGCGTGETRNCGVDQGACSAGVQECDDNGYWTICFGAGYKKAEPEECDGRDNDCDGSIDEGCGCTESQTQQCGTDIGECELGEQSCIDGKWGACLGGKSKLSETGSQCSDNKDNDCDGKTDSEDENCQATSSLKPVCYDGKQNQNEEEIDCGGENCPPCDQVTCNDKQKNGDEEGIDCGGTRDCPSCKEKKTTKTKTTTKDEVEEDTGEETFEDFEEDTGFPWMYLIVVVVVLGGIIFLLYNKFAKQPTGKEQRPTATAKTMTKLTTQQQPQARPTRQKITQSRDESALAKSIEESKKLFEK